LRITKTRGKVVGDVQESQFFGLDGHKSVFALHGVFDEVPLGKVGKEVYFHGVDVVTPRVETDDGEFMPKTL